jgi:uncharacterized protein YkwD
VSDREDGEMARLEIRDPESVREVELTGVAVIGRAEGAALRIAEPRASREHAEVRPVPGGVLVTDLGSTNGTWRGEERILREKLGAGEEFRIGETFFRIPDAPSPVRPPRTRASAALAGVVGPAAVLFLLVLVGVHALKATREEVVDHAENRLGLATWKLAMALPDPAARLEALREVVEKWPGRDFADRARSEMGRIEPRLETTKQARAALADLEKLQKDDSLAFPELRFRYEKLLKQYDDVPEVSEEIRARVHEMYEAHQEALTGMVADVCRQARAAAKEGQYGRAASLLNSFVQRNPAAAAARESDLRTVESQVMNQALFAYRNVISRADKLADGGDRAKAAELLRTEATGFNGTRFHVFLRLRADSFAERPSGTKTSPGAKEDLLALRRSYYLLAQQAEELAGAGLFSSAADKYEAILETVRIPAIRDEFAERMKELRNLDGLLSRLRERVAMHAGELGGVTLGKAHFRVMGIEHGMLVLSRGGQTVTRAWASLDPEDYLALMRAARLQGADRLLVAVYCFDLNLMDDFRTEILADLDVDALREEAGRLYARKEGRAYPEGGFVAYKGRILSRAEHAEVVHREQVAKLRDRQAALFTKLEQQPVFAKKLAKLRELRASLDQAREHALSLIFDEVKYFYPYQDRREEYEIVQKEVDKRVDAVREVWNNAFTTTLKEEAGTKSILADIGRVDAELAKLGIDTSGFEAKVAGLTRYLGQTFTVRNFYLDDAERDLFVYDDRVMDYNSKVESIATEPERRQVAITNGYRMMMGRRALVLDDRLVRTARGHSDEMSSEGYFSHFSPHADHRTPDLRARKEGYEGTALSENIHRGSGSPEGAHLGWLHSSGHHRNILAKWWTEMGTGQSGKYWTQNFGRTHVMQFSDANEGK